MGYLGRLNSRIQYGVGLLAVITFFFASVAGLLMGLQNGRSRGCMPFPAWAVEAFLGQMGRELLLAGTRVLPTRLASTGFVFRYDDAESALRSILAPRSTGGRR